MSSKQVHISPPLSLFPTRTPAGSLAAAAATTDESHAIRGGLGSGSINKGNGSGLGLNIIDLMQCVLRFETVATFFGEMFRPFALDLGGEEYLDITQLVNNGALDNFGVSAFNSGNINGSMSESLWSGRPLCMNSSGNRPKVSVDLTSSWKKLRTLKHAMQANAW